MRKSIWLLLVILVAMTVMGVSRFVKQASHLPVIEHISREVPQQQLQSSTLEKAPLVSADKLFSHIQKLNFRRYSANERSLVRSYITTQLQKFGWKPQLQRFDEGVNILAEHPGTDKSAGAILVGAHYDTVSVSPGADDNGTGVAVILEIARLLGSRSTTRTLQLAFFDKEEAGLLGSTAFVSKKTNLRNLRGAVILDMVGYACYTAGCQEFPSGFPIAPKSDKGDFLAVIADAEHIPLLNAFENSHHQLPPVLTLPIPLKGLLTPDTLRSDHAAFWFQGVGAALVSDTANLRTPHYHQPSDKPNNIVRSFFTGSAQLVVNAVNSLIQKNEILTTPKPN